MNKRDIRVLLKWLANKLKPTDKIQININHFPYTSGSQNAGLDYVCTIKHEELITIKDQKAIGKFVAPLTDSNIDQTRIMPYHPMSEKHRCPNLVRVDLSFIRLDGKEIQEISGVVLSNGEMLLTIKRPRHKELEQFVINLPEIAKILKDIVIQFRAEIKDSFGFFPWP